MRGVVQSGGTTDVVPLPGLTVTLWLGARPVAHTTAREDGSFRLTCPVTVPDSIFYLVADNGAGLMLMALLGSTLPDNVVLNELTTVAAVYCAAQFLENDGSIHGSDFALRIVAGMSANVVDVATGASSSVLLSSPNADQTNALRASLSLANLLASAVRSDSAPLFKLAHGSAPRNTIAALHAIARHPAHNVDAIFLRSKALEVYEPSLRLPPNAWTLAVKVNDSGNDANMFGGPGNLAFDRNGNAWITNNVIQGETISTQWSIVLDCTGKPAVNSAGQLMSPFTGGGLLGAGFGVAISNDGENVWIGNFGWGKVNPTPQGSVSVFDLDANPLTPDDGYQQSTYRVQGIAFDRSGNVWMASYGNHSAVVYLNGDPSNAVAWQISSDPDEQTTFTPFDVAIAPDGTAWMTNSQKDNSGVVQLSLENGEINLVRNLTAGQTVKGVVIDSLGNVWIASGDDSKVYAFDRDGNALGSFDGGGIDGPWGITVDGDDHIWAANFGPLEHGTNFEGRLTQLAGANPATRPPGLALGDPISPPGGYTLPTAGDPVLLHDGTPLYGPDGPPSFIPMMRSTGVSVDAAGNVWTCNNWKPSFDTDLTVNPGGDGMLIFLGLAKPPAR